MSAYWTVIIKNYSDSTSDIIIEDLGLPISSGGQVVLSDQFSYDEITGSDDLRELVENSDLVVNDGISDLDPYEGVRWITIQNVKNLEDDYYSKEELQSGQGIVHWDNIVGAPESALVNGWLDPVEYRVLDITGTEPSSPNNQDIYANTTDDTYYIWDSTSWNPLGVVNTNDRVINLSDPIENIYTFNGLTWLPTDSTSVAEDNWAVTVGDDGDGKQAIYTYDATLSKWVKIADVDLSDHLNGGPSKHNASEIDVEGSYVNIPGTPTDLETTIGSIDTVFGTILKSDKLDFKNGLLSYYDDSRSKWLSVATQTIAFGKPRLTTRQYLGYYGSTFPSNKSGILIPRNATIISLSGRFDIAGSAVFEIVNDSLVVIASLTITSAVGLSDITVNANIDAGDSLHCRIDPEAPGVYDPYIILELAWRA